jgi:hypothetical protein
MSAKILEQVRIAPQPTTELAVVVGWQPGVGVEVTLDDGSRAMARAIVALSVEQLDAAVAQSSEVLVTFVGNDRTRPMILGFVAEVPPSSEAEHAEAAPDVIKVRANEEIQFRCGKASLTLRRDGAVIVRGEKVISRAAKNNRITGGSVQIN